MNLEEKVMANQALLAAHAEKLRSIQERQTELKQLTLSTKELAVSLSRITEKLSNVDDRLKDMEDSGKNRALTVWACVVTGIVGAAVVYIMSGVFS